MEKKLRAGVIGLGMGRHHIEGYRTHPQVEVVAIADPDTTRLEAIGKQFDVAARYASPAAMLAREELDVVSIATPNKFHKELTLEAFKAGCHVLCEKPMAMNAQEGQEMLEAARQAERRLMINFSYRFTDMSQAIKRQVEAGLLGDVYFARTIWHRRRGIPGFGGWFGTKALSGGGPLIDLGVHRLNFALWLMNYPRPAWVLANTYNHIGSALARQENKTFDVEDLAVAMIRFENGATLELEASWAANIREQELMETRLLGTRGGLLQRNRGEGYEFESEMYLERDGCQMDLQLHPPLPPAQCSMAHFADCILTGRQHTASGEEGLAVTELLDAIYQSAESGVPVGLGD